MQAVAVGLADVRHHPQSARSRACRADPVHPGGAVRAGRGPRRRPLRPAHDRAHLPDDLRPRDGDACDRHRRRLDDARVAAGHRVRDRLGARLRADHADHAAAGDRAAVAAVARHRGRRVGDADRGDRRAGAGRAALRGQPDPGLCAVLHALLHVEHSDRQRQGRAQRDLARADQPRGAVRRLPLHPAQSGHPRHHLARSVRGHPRRRVCAAAGVRPRRVPRRPLGAWAAARVARRRRADRRRDPGPPAAAPAGRADHLRRGRRSTASPSSSSRCRILSCCRWRCSPCSAPPT